MNWWDYLNPFERLGSAAAKIAGDAWIAVMLAVWNAGLWFLRLVLQLADTLTTPDLSEGGPGAQVYRITVWIAGVLAVALALVQIGTAVIRRDGRSLARVVIGVGQFGLVCGGWVAYGVTVVAACGGLTRALMEALLGVGTWSAWQPWAPFTARDIVDGTLATVLGLMGLLLWIAAIGHLLVLLTRSASLLVLAAVTPIAAAGLVSEVGRSWFWKSLRWFHAAAFTPPLMVLVLGVGVQLTTGVAAGAAPSLETAIGTAVPGVVLVCVAAASPLALFKLLAFVDPHTTSGAAMRSGLAAVGGLQGLLRGQSPASGGAAGAESGADGRSSGEAGAEDATNARFATAGSSPAGGPGPMLGGWVAGGLGVIATLGGRGAAVGADLTNQMGVGHNTFPPDFTLAGLRATNADSGPDGPAGDSPSSTNPTPDSSDPGPGSYPDSASYPDDWSVSDPEADVVGIGGPPTAGSSAPGTPAVAGSGSAGGPVGAGSAGGSGAGSSAASGVASVGAEAAVVAL